MLGVPKALAALGVINPVQPIKFSRSLGFKIAAAVGLGAAIMVREYFSPDL